MNQFFPPDAAPTGQLLGDLACELTRRGHDVTVLTGNSTYGPDHGNSLQGIRVVRVPVVSFSRMRATRLLSWTSFLVASALRSLLLPKQHLVIALTTPPALSVIAACCARLWSARLWIWEMDLYPDIAICLQEVQSDATWVRCLSGLIHWSRRSAYGIVALGECMQARLTEGGVDPSKVVIAQNWTAGGRSEPRPVPKDGPLRILYSGNFGLAHDRDTICDVIRALKNDDRFRFAFIGDGANKRMLEQVCQEEQLKNVTFRPYGSAADLERNLAECDISLVTLKPEAIGAVVPSKVYRSFAARRPVLFIGPSRAESARCLKRYESGWAFEAGDADGVIALLRTIWSNRQMVALAGDKAYDGYMLHHTVSAGTERIVRALTPASNSNLKRVA